MDFQICTWISRAANGKQMQVRDGVSRKQQRCLQIKCSRSSFCLAFTHNIHGRFAMQHQYHAFECRRIVCRRHDTPRVPPGGSGESLGRPSRGFPRVSPWGIPLGYPLGIPRVRYPSGYSLGHPPRYAAEVPAEVPPGYPQECSWTLSVPPGTPGGRPGHTIKCYSGRPGNSKGVQERPRRASGSVPRPKRPGVPRRRISS